MWLPGIEWSPTHKHYQGRGGNAPVAAVIHWTAMPQEGKRTAEIMRKGRRNSSYNFLISRDGTIYQCVDTEDGAWHAGDRGGVMPHRSHYMPGRVNKQTIGIGLCNLGHAANSVRYVLRDRSEPIRDWRVGSKPRRYENYPPVQIASLIWLLDQLRRLHPSLEGITGHRDTCLFKIDPGPLLPREEIVRSTGLPWVHNTWPKQNGKRVPSWSENFYKPEASTVCGVIDQ